MLSCFDHLAAIARQMFLSNSNIVRVSGWIYMVGWTKLYHIATGAG